MNPTLVPFARGDSSIKITAMIGIGLMAIPTANGRISPITEPIRSSASAQVTVFSHHSAFMRAIAWCDSP
jgi:hypothetical protein